jgi:hypothetical protein
MKCLTSADKDKGYIKSPLPLFRNAPEPVVEVNELGILPKRREIDVQKEKLRRVVGYQLPFFVSFWNMSIYYHTKVSRLTAI